MERPRTAPAIDRKVSEVTPGDIRVRVLGTIVESTPEYSFLEDETGKMKVRAENPLTDGKKVRIFARPTQEEGELALNAEIVQDMQKLDEKLYKRWAALKNIGGIHG